MAGFDDTLRKVQAMGKQRDADFAAAAAALPGFARSYSMSFAIGARVIDLVTGQTGTVTSGKRESITFPTPGVNGSGNDIRQA
jgi:hypothetical protein